MKLNQVNQTALRRCEDIEEQIKKLSAFVATRKTMAQKNQVPDWSYVGDLGHLQEKLGELHCLS